MKGKYIIVLVLGHEVPILFSPLIPHKHFLSCFCKEAITSAGFFEVFSDPPSGYHHVIVSGRSESLMLDYRSVDEDIIEKFLN